MQAKRQTGISGKGENLFSLPALLLMAAFLLMATGLVVAQSASNTPASSNAAAPGVEDIVPFLNQTIVWSRQVTAEQQLVTQPSDAVFLNDSRQTADQVVRLAFDFARARAQALASQPGTVSSGQTGVSQYQRLAESVILADQKVKSLQQELDGYRQQLLTVTGRKRVTLQALVSETEGEL
jgi:hypothetical protein